MGGKTTNHKGLDIVGDDDRRVLAVRGGVVAQSRMVTDRSNLTWEWGNYVCVKAPDGLLYYYCHMDSRSVGVGDAVKEGDQIGVMGNTGMSFGAHLHFEIRNSAKTSIDPTPILGIGNAVGTYTNTGAAKTAEAGPPCGTCLVVHGAAKGINVQAFTGRDVNLVAREDSGADIRVADGKYPILAMEGSAGEYQWCRINYGGKPVFMPFGGVLDDRCTVE